MKSVALDVHQEKTQFTVALETGEVVIQKVVASRADVLRLEVASVSGPKRVVLENNGWAARIFDAVREVADEVIVCDTTRNKLISHAEDSDDEKDAKRLGLLSRTGGLYPVYVPPEPYRTLRSLVRHESGLTRDIAKAKIRLKAFCRRHQIVYRGRGIYQERGRASILQNLPDQAQFQLRSQFRVLEGLRKERLLVRRELRQISLRIPCIARLQTIPGVGPVIARTLAAWIVDPGRFKSFSALSTYAGLGLRQDISNWKIVRPPHASKRGQRALKSVLFLAARAAIAAGQNAFAQRYKHRMASPGWDDRKAVRDIARKILFCAAKMWTPGQAYDDARINTFA